VATNGRIVATVGNRVISPCAVANIWVNCFGERGIVTLTARSTALSKELLAESCMHEPATR
jgi:hypothetical protein